VAKTLFDLGLLGEGIERRYRRMRPEVERLPWGSFEPSRYPERARIAARRAWTLSAFQEHRTAQACAELLSALIAAQTPLDLLAMATRFPLDEIVHVELCVRLANELGGATPILHDPQHMIPRARPGLSPILTAAELIVGYFCVGEAISVPMLRGTWHATRHPLPKGVLGVIVKDEAAHGQFGWIFLDWADAQLDDDARAHLGRVAGTAIADLERTWREVEAREADEALGRELGWMEPTKYVTLARRALGDAVLAPLEARGITPR
jgi:hypothetical protein